MISAIFRLRAKGNVPFFCVGPSMYPVLRPGDELLGRPVDAGHLSVGDVIVYYSDQTECMVVHRVIRIEEDTVVTQGDNCDKPDMCPVPMKEIRAKINYLRRGENIKRISGGTLGRIRRHIVVIIRHSKTRLYNPASLLVNLATLVPLAKTVFNFVLRPTIIRLGDTDSREMMLLARGKVIGHRKQRASSWNVHPLFKPFVYKDELPD